MRDRRPEVEIIQLLSPDDPSWDGPVAPASAAPPPSGGNGPQRWWMIVGSLAAVAAIATAVVTLGGADEPNAALPPTTETTETTVRTAPSLAADPAPAQPPAFVLDDPSVRPYSADVLTPPDTRSSYQLWTAVDGSGSWLTVQIASASQHGVAFAHAVRRVFDGQEIIDHDGVSTVIVPLSRDRTATVTGGGVVTAELLGLSQATLADEADVTSGPAMFAAHGLRLVADVNSPEQLIYGFATTETSYLDSNGDVIALRGAADTMEDRMQTLPYIADGLQTIDDRVVGTLRANGDTIVVWQYGDFVLSLTSRLDPATMVALSTTARGPTDEEWTSLHYGLHPDYRIGPFARIAVGPASLAPPWGAGVQSATRGGVAKYLWWWTLPDHPNMAASIETGVDLGAEVASESIVVPGATYVFVSVPADHVERHAVVTSADGSVITLDLRPALGTLAAFVGAVQLSQPGPATVELTP